MEWKWKDKEKPLTKKECTLVAEVLVDLVHGSTPLEIFQKGMNELLEINFSMGINKLPSLEDH